MKDKLKEERKRLGLSQEQMAKLAEIPKRTYCDYEYGISEPKASFLEKISKHGVDILYIVTGIRNEKVENTEPPVNYTVLNKKRMDNLMDDLTAQQQAEVIKVAEEKKRLNQCELALEELKKSTA